MTDSLYRTGARDERTAQLLKGYAKGGAIDAGDRKAVHAHERHMHKGEKETKLARGGKVPKAVNVVVHAGGAQTAADMGKQMGMQQGMRMGAALGARAAASKMQQMGAQRPPMAGPAPGMGAPGGAGPMMARGGKVQKREMGGAMLGAVQPGMEGIKAVRRGGIVKIDAGAGSGIGRLEKIGERVKVRAHTRRKAGGKV